MLKANWSCRQCHAGVEYTIEPGVRFTATPTPHKPPACPICGTPAWPRDDKAAPPDLRESAAPAAPPESLVEAPEGPAEGVRTLLSYGVMFVGGGPHGEVIPLRRQTFLRFLSLSFRPPGAFCSGVIAAVVLTQLVKLLVYWLGG